MRLMRTTRHSVPFRARLTAVCWPLIAVLIPSTAATAEPRPSSHQYIPAVGLVAYLEFDGLDAHAGGWKDTAAHALLAKTRAGAMMTEAVRQWADWQQLKDEPGLLGLTGADFVAHFDHIMRRGFILAIHDRGAERYVMTIVLNGFTDKKFRERSSVIQGVFGLDGKGGGLLSRPARLRGRNVYMIGNDEQRFRIADGGLVRERSDPWLTAWAEGDDLLIIEDLSEPEALKTVSDLQKGHVTAVFDTIERKLPNVTTHPGYLSALAGDKDIKGFEPTGLLFAGPINSKGFYSWIRDDAQRESKLPGMPGRTELANQDPVWGVIEADGLDEIKRIAARWGFQGKALLTDIRIDAPAPRKVLSVCLNQPALSKTLLPPLPPGINSFAVASFDPAKSYQTLGDLLNSTGPKGIDEVRRIEKMVRDVTDLRLRDDLLQHVGPTWWAFRVPAVKGDSELNKADLASYALLTGVDDAQAFANVLGKLAPRFNQYLRDLEPENAENRPAKKRNPLPEIGLERLPAPDQGYRVTSAGCRALGLNTEVEPVILVEKSFIAVAANLDRARAALASTSRQGSSRKPSDELALVLDSLPPRLTFLAFADHRESSLPDWIVAFPRALQRVSNMTSENDCDNASAQCLLDLIGIPRPGGLAIRITPPLMPKADELRPYLFPSVLAATADDRGYRLISRQVLPLEFVTHLISSNFSIGAGWTADNGFHFWERISLYVLGFDLAKW